MKIHAIFDFELGKDSHETFCNLLVILERNEAGTIARFKTPAGNTIQCTFGAREADITCINCRCVWRKMRAAQ